MIYRNNIEDEKKFLKKYYLTVGIPVLIALPIYFFMFNYIFDFREDLAQVKWVIYLSMSIATIFVISVALICGKRHKKNYEKYELEISETELISRTDRVQKVIQMNELAKVDFSKSSRIVVYDVPPKVNLDKFIKANKVVKMTGVVIDFSSIPAG